CPREAMSDPRAAFIEAAVWHGTLERAEAILAVHPEIASSDIHSAAILGDDAAVRRFLELEPANATVKGGPRGWDALTHLCFSKYLRLDRARSAGFVRAAQGFEPNRRTRWGKTALHNAVLSDNALEIFEVLLDHAADPTLIADHPNRSSRAFPVRSAVAMAARRGRGDVLQLFERRGVAIELQGVERLIAACARNDAAAIRSIAAREPQLVREVVAEGGKLLAEFAGTWNTAGVRQLLDLGVPVTALYEGDAYFDIAKDSTALHVAAWKGLAPTVQLLIERGAPVDAKDGKGRTPLALAVKACVDSYWTYRRTPEAV